MNKSQTTSIQSFLILLIILLLLLTTACTSASNEVHAQAQAIHLQDCQLAEPGTSLRVEARCGKLAVYENRAAASGRQIELNIAIVPAVSRNPAPDPLFFIPGGPGEAAAETYVSLHMAFNRINQKRDIVLVDQRGTGKSHPLECAADENEAPADETAPTETILQNCLDRLDADPRFYTTSIAMDDLDQVRAALGYDKINLYGASYGTRAALVFLRQHPNHVRSVILDGVAPPNWTLGPAAAGDGQRALEMLFARCASEPNCKLAFPEISSEFENLTGSLQEHPVEVALDDPFTGKPTTLTLSSENLASTIHLLTYAPETAALIPLMIHSAAARQDFRPIAARIIATHKTVGNSISAGMRFSVVCAEDVPFYQAESASKGYLGSFILDAFEQICQTWPAGEIPGNFKEPVRSDVPVLILSGEADPVTPPTNGEMAAQYLPNSLHLIVPGMGHINIFRGCIPKLASAFIDQDSSQGLDASCAEQISPMPAFIDFNGPTP